MRRRNVRCRRPRRTTWNYRSVVRGGISLGHVMPQSQHGGDITGTENAQGSVWGGQPRRLNQMLIQRRTFLMTAACMPLFAHVMQNLKAQAAGDRLLYVGTYTNN